MTKIGAVKMRRFCSKCGHAAYWHRANYGFRFRPCSKPFSVRERNAWAKSHPHLPKYRSSYMYRCPCQRLTVSKK